MKTLKSIKLSTSIALLMGISIISVNAFAQEYDDMYFNKSDRKKPKVEAKKPSETSTATYKQALESTESVSSKNINPEYIARYKDTETTESSSAYSDNDYYVEGYNKVSPTSESIDYAALNLRDQMSQSNQNRNYSTPSWGFSPFMSMGYGMGHGMPFYDPFMSMGHGMPFGHPSFYDPYMGMGFGSGLSMGYGFGNMGFGMRPGMSYNMGMSWGTGYNPWGGWGSPYNMFGYNPYRSAFGSPYSGAGMMCGLNSFYAMNRPYYNVANTNYPERNLNYKPRTTSGYADSKIARTTATENGARTANPSSRIRTATTPANSESSNGRVVNQDYSRSQNEYYNSARRNASSSTRISTTTPTSGRSATGSSNSSLGSNRPTRSSDYSNYNSQSSSGSRSTSSYSSGSTNRTSSGSSYSSPNRSGSSGVSTGGGSRSYSSGSSSSGGSSTGSGSSSSGRGGRQ